MDNSWNPCRKEESSTVSPLTVLDSSFGLVKSFSNNPPYYDEPKLFSMAAVLNLPDHIQSYIDEIAPDLAVGFAGGASLNKDRALWKVAGESIERYALILQNAKYVISDFSSLLEDSALDPNTIVAGTEPIPPNRHSSVISWVNGFRIFDGQQKLIPTQLVAVPHIFAESEIVWRSPITTGAAAASCLEEALYLGLSE